MNNIRTQILEVFAENGVYFADDELTDKLELDSLTYITIIVDLEKKFGIEISDTMLDHNTISFLDIENSINKSLQTSVVDF